MTNQRNLPIQTLRLSEREKTKLLWAIDQANRRDDTQDQRRLRVSCTNNEAVFTLKAEGTGQASFAMLARNLSRWGAALVHGRYLHPQSRCELMLQTNSGDWEQIPGIVRHARHIQGMVHELGIEFDVPIELGDFVRLTPEQETRYLQELADDGPDTDEADIVRLSNRVLVIDDFASDRKLYSHWLTRSGFTVTTTSDSRNACAQVQQQVFDLLVIDDKLDSGNGVELIKALRSNRVTAPIIAISSDESEGVEAQLLEAGADCFLKKPFTEAQLKEKAYEIAGVDTTADLSPILSAYKDDTEMRPLLTEFTRGLSEYVDELRDANAQSDFETIEYLSHRLKGAGSGYGFPAISDQAAELLHAMNAEAVGIDQIKQATSELIATLNRVKLG